MTEPGVTRRHLVVCCDGTWNTPDQEQQGRPTPTNVARIHHTVANLDSQPRYYHPGVGTGPGLLDHLEGGLVGKGLSENIKSAYGWLARTYSPGDAIHLFGFSRGAFTVRSLSGMIRRCGLPADLKTAGSTEFWAEVDRLFTTGYREGAGEAADPVPIEFLGVWDTVGSLGIPDWLGPLKLVEDHVGHLPRFHDTKLGDHVKHARQALAIDEMRGPFMPTLWSNLHEVDGDRTAVQVWFPGDHCDVGGGHDSSGLSDAALQWMIDECRAVVPDLVFDDGMYKQITPDAQGVLHNSLHSVYTVLCPAPRAFPFIAAGSAGVAPSAVDRQATPPITTGPYREGRRLEAGQSATVDVYAGKPWNWTGIYLDPGEYEFAAEGTWLNGKIAHHPDGTEADARLDVQDVLHALATTSAWLQAQLARLNDAQARPFGGRRCEAAKWMTLTGAVAAPNLDAHDVQQPYEAFPIGGRLAKWVNRKPGYFYAFANDSWLGYSGNRGSVRLTIKRLT
jgi:hypothetical protein